MSQSLTRSASRARIHADHLPSLTIYTSRPQPHACRSPIQPSTSSNRTLHTTAPLSTRERDAMHRWINGPGAVFKRQREGSTNYLGAYDKAGRYLREMRMHRLRKGGRSSSTPKSDDDGNNDDDVEGGGGLEESRAVRGKDGKDELPPENKEDLKVFPLNPFFRSQPVLSEEMRDEVYRRVVEAGQTVREVSQALGISMERVGAVVRLKTVENDWAREGKTPALPYARAILSMLPTTPYPSTGPYAQKHESINDLPVHPSTLPQIFHPVSESRHFTRTDAGHVFSPHLRPADERIPHPDMIATEAEKSAGMNVGERTAKRKGRWDAEVQERRERKRRKLEVREKGVSVVKGERWDFRVKEVEGESIGRDGKRIGKVGWRYGTPLADRKKGAVKIVTRVEA